MVATLHPVLLVFLSIILTNCYTRFQESQNGDPTNFHMIHADELVKWNTRYPGDIFWSLNVGHIGACAVMCVRMTKCVTFNFDLESHMCEMNSNTPEYNTGQLLRKRNWVYSKIQDWPRKLDPHCYQRPCDIDEVCLPREIASILDVDSNFLCLKTHGSKSLTSDETLITTSTSTPTSSISTLTSTASTTSTTTSTPSTTSTSTTTSATECLSAIEPYTGNISVTNNGQTCQYWADQEPHAHEMTDDDFPYDGSLGEANNFCREFDDPGRPWCYTTNPEIRWGYCTFKICEVGPIPCGGTHTEAVGSISSSSLWRGRYDCVWFIRADVNHVIQYQVEVLRSNSYLECSKFKPLSIIYSTTRMYLCGYRYEYKHGVTTSDTIMIYYYSDGHKRALDFTLYYRTKDAEEVTDTWDSCFPLRAPWNGLVDVSDSKLVGQTAEYSCNTCFMLYGTKQRTCLPIGMWEWDGTEPYCAAIPRFEDSCYYFFMTEATWLDALDKCEDLHDNAYFVVLGSEEENDFIIGTLNRLQGGQNHDWWIGLSAIDGAFEWDRGYTTGIPYTNWLQGHGIPNSQGEERCVILYHAEEFKWMDKDCEETHYFICELDIA